MKLITTNRLSACPFQASDFEPLSAIFADRDVMKFFLSGKVFSREESTRFVEEYFVAYENSGKGLGVLCERLGRQIIGFAGIVKFTYADQNVAEFGFVIAKLAQGRGYATEIGHALIKYALDELDLNNLYATVHPDNPSSKRVMEKLGLKVIDRVENSDRGARLIYRFDKS